MTEKELLYVEDAVEHEEAIIKICNDFLTKLNDQKLSNFISGEINSHQEMKDKLMNLLKEKVNG